MKKFFLLITAIFCAGCLSAQSISSSVMSASGTSFESENFTLHFSIGEPLNTIIEEGDVTISQGVLQIILNKITPVEETALSNAVEVYPNPTADIISINISDAQIYECKLFDVNGTLLHQETLSNQKSKFNIEHLPKATYLLKVLRNNKIYQNMKIVKL